MKLKTLKDIKYDKLFAPFPNKPSIEPFILSDYKTRLKKEVIRWIKEDLKCMSDNEDKIKVVQKGTRYIDIPEIRRWITRFNLKDEEFKLK